jgi:hypothetical protein
VFTYLETTVTKQNYIRDGIESRFNLGNAWNLSFQNLLSLKTERIKIKKNVHAVWHGCETWSLTMRKEHRLRVSENRVLRRIFGSKRKEVAAGEYDCIMRIFISCTLRVIKSRRMRWAGHVASMGQMRNVYNILVRRPEGKRPLGRPGRILEYILGK